jgi:hypothetical protein
MNHLSTLSDEDLISYYKLYPALLSKREKDTKTFGFSTKFAYHVIRLINECEQILTTGDLDLEQNREQLKAVRRGEMTPEDIRKYFTMKEEQLEKLYHDSTAVPMYPDEKKIKELLLQCLEHHYGSMSDAIQKPSREQDILNDLSLLLTKYMV